MNPPASIPARPLLRGGRALVTSITLDAPMLGVEPARLALKCLEKDLMDWIASGELEWAFDFRRKGAGRCCLRILTESVVLKQRRRGPFTPRDRRAQDAHAFTDIFDSIFQHRKPVLLSTELARAWSCGTAHIHNLIEDGLLAVEPRRYALREARIVPREAASKFMQSRRIQ